MKNKMVGEEIDRLTRQGFSNMYIEQQGRRDAKDAARGHVDQICKSTSDYAMHMIAQPGK